MDRNTLIELMLEQKKEFEMTEGYVQRRILKDIEGYIELPYIIVITGLRRCGKSVLLKQVRETFYKGRPVYYFNFEDDRLSDFKVKDFDLLYETLIEVYGDSDVFFFDEIQNIEGWERFVRRMHDRHAKIFVTGSNATMISKELGTRLTGRYLPVELYPFSFQEFLDFKGMSGMSLRSVKDRGAIRAAFTDYLALGGIPEYLTYGKDIILNTLFDNIIYKDMIVRYELTDEKAVKDLAMYLLSNYSTEISFNGLKNMLNLGSPNTVKNYLQYMENAYLAFSVPKFEHSLKKQIYAKKKTYVIDSGLVRVKSMKFLKDAGRLLENIVFLELKRSGWSVYFYKGAQECDFILAKDKNISSAIQVSLNLDTSKQREYGGLLEAMSELKLKEGLILTQDTEFEDKIDGKCIIVKPVWKWLLEK